MCVQLSSRDVDEAVDAVEVDEGAEVDDVADRALDDVAHVEVVDDLLTHLFALLFEHGAPAEDHVVAVAVHLDDAAVELLRDVLLEVLHAADVDQRGRQEAAHAEVEDEAALDDLDDGALDRLAALEGAFDALPGLLELGALLAEDQRPSASSLVMTRASISSPNVDLFGGVDVLADTELVDRDDAFGLVADVDEDLVLVDAHDVAGDDVALAEHRHGDVVVGDDLAVDLDEEAFAALHDPGVVGRRELCVDWFLCHVVS